MSTSLHRFLIRLAIRFVDFIESQCYQAQTVLRSRLSPDTLPSPRQAESAATISDLGLAWRVTKVLFLLLGIVAFVAFFSTLRTVYFVAFAFMSLAEWFAVFSLVRLIYRKKVSAVPRESARSKILPARARSMPAAAENTPRSPGEPSPRFCSSSPRHSDGRGESFAEWEVRRAGIRLPAHEKKHRRRGRSSAEFNRRLSEELEIVFAGAR